VFKKKRSVGGMAQVVEHLSSKCEALSSNPELQKKKSKLNYHNEMSDTFKFLAWITLIFVNSSFALCTERITDFKISMCRKCTSVYLTSFLV
jgi:hypothetical protein